MHTKLLLLLVAAGCCLWSAASACQSIEQRYKFANSNIYVRLRRGDKLQYELMKGDKSLQTVTFDNFATTSSLVETEKGGYQITDGTNTIEFTLVKSGVATGTGSEVTHVRVARDQVLQGQQPRDCFSLNTGATHWFSGPEQKQHYWPVERQTHSNYSYLPKEQDNFGVGERYWLNSDGVFLYVENNTPLFIDQNSAGYEGKLCFSATSALPYDPRVTSSKFIYHVAVAKDAKAAHKYAVKTFLGQPTGYPDERMVRHPVWSTWALYKAEVDDTVIRDFAQQILDNGFNNSQLEIDDDWEDCYGALTFRKNKFPATKTLTDDLKALGFRVTLWIHPFINNNCTAIYDEAKALGYLALDHAGSSDTQWWNSQPKDAAILDFTKTEVQEWFAKRLKRLQDEEGIDSFKFDAGETTWLPSDPVLQGDGSMVTPLQAVGDYVRTVAAFGDMVEVRSAQNTQDLPIFVRIVDKDSEWGWNNGLITLITSMLQMNLNGYPFVLPDMIGGNGYNERPPNKELFLRWLQANVFMPALQYSFVPWNFDQEAITISKTHTNLHAEYTPYIMKLFKRAVETGEPVNAPLWWIAPTDAVAQGIYDQFLLGDDIIAAPVVTEGATQRDVYLPAGEWKNGNGDEVYKGPIWIMDYPAPLDTLPYFVRVGFEMN
ncbi:LOW QUALITY PROTEIN: myogenesis-regulating glycosidase [Drosophila subobscura]|uniref:LOW QUALITY PROTEIN: myogenesis-regulating glycosidase n=1 Tax=Drosophila subobscura TaxID=7241 RepID=UPI00155ADF3A|nr:LOW QUALITY PROTEIN: myogenesis-regulating glycosidase [Drosophila subobscura]